MEKTVINLKTDKKLKEEAQKVAKELGFPLGTIINGYLRDLVRKKEISFSISPTPNEATKKILDAAIKDIKKNGSKNTAGPFHTEKEMLNFLDTLKK